MPQIVGHLLDVEDVPPYVDRATNEIKRDRFTRLHVLEGRDKYEVSVPRDFAGTLPQPQTGPHAFAVRIRAWASRGGASIGYDLTGIAPVTSSK